MKPTPEQLAQKAVILARLALAERSYAQTAPSATLRHHGFAMARLLEQRVREIAQEIEKIGGWERLNKLAAQSPSLDIFYGHPRKTAIPEVLNELLCRQFIHEIFSALENDSSTFGEKSHG